MRQKTVLLIDDEQSFLEPLADALESEGHLVLKARTAEEGLNMLSTREVDVVTIDIMLDPGIRLEDKVYSHSAGLYVCEEVRRRFPNVDAFCISVISEENTIQKIQKLGIQFLRKGETPLRTVLKLIRTRLSGVAYSSERTHETDDIM